MNRRTFVKVAALAPLTVSAANIPPVLIGEEQQMSANQCGIAVRFLGTGAADWNGRDARGELRRLSSILVDGHVLIDFTPSVANMLPDGVCPDMIFYTHSHGDHFHPEAALRAGVKRVYLSQTWYDRAVADFRNAAKALQHPMPDIIPLIIGQRVQLDDLVITAVPANHATSHLFEQPLLFLLEKGPVRLLYATDTAGLPAVTTRMLGIDAHVADARPLTGLIMEATMGMDQSTDFRHFTHSDVSEVERTVEVLEKTRRYLPPAGQPVYLTHLARTLHGTQAELDARLPVPLKAAHDGLEVIFR